MKPEQKEKETHKPMLSPTNVLAQASVDARKIPPIHQLNKTNQNHHQQKLSSLIKLVLDTAELRYNCSVLLICDVSYPPATSPSLAQFFSSGSEVTAFTHLLCSKSVQSAYLLQQCSRFERRWWERAFNIETRPFTLAGARYYSSFGYRYLTFYFKCFQLVGVSFMEELKQLLKQILLCQMYSLFC